MTLLFIKPEGVMRGLIGEIVSRMEKKGLDIVASKLLKMSRAQAEQLYSPHKGKPFYEQLINHVISGPIFAMVLEGPSSVSVVRKMVGATDPRSAEPGTIRGDFGLAITPNIVHASDSLDSARREIPIFFKDGEIILYEKPTEKEYVLQR